MSLFSSGSIISTKNGKQLTIKDGFFKGVVNYEQDKDILTVKSLKDCENCKFLLREFMANCKMDDNINKIKVENEKSLNKFMKDKFYFSEFVYNQEQYIWVKPDIMRPENQYDSITDAALHTFNLSKGLHQLYSKEGTIHCGRGAFDSSHDNFVIYFIWIKPELRGQHIWSNVLRKLSKNDKINKISVCAVPKIPDFQRKSGIVDRPLGRTNDHQIPEGI